MTLIITRSKMDAGCCTSVHQNAWPPDNAPRHVCAIRHELNRSAGEQCAAPALMLTAYLNDKGVVLAPIEPPAAISKPIRICMRQLELHHPAGAAECGDAWMLKLQPTQGE